MPAQYSIDFSLVASLERPRAFTVLPQALASALAGLPETCARAEAAIHFTHQVGSLGVMDRGPDGAPLALREAYFRAALSEFSSMQEILPRDLASISDGPGPIKITDLHNPLLHVVYELRHLNVHLVSTRLDRATRPAIWRVDGKDHEFDYEMWLVRNLDLPTFTALRNAARYRKRDGKELVDWFNREQREWGADHLLFLAVCTYGQALVEHYELGT